MGNSAYDGQARRKYLDMGEGDESRRKKFQIF